MHCDYGFDFVSSYSFILVLLGHVIASSSYWVGGEEDEFPWMGYLDLARKYTHNSNKPDQVHDSARGCGLFLLLAICALTDLAVPGWNLFKLSVGPGLVFLIFSLCHSIFLPLLSVKCQWGSLYENQRFWSTSIHMHSVRFPALQRPLSESIRTVSLKMKQRDSQLWY